MSTPNIDNIIKFQRNYRFIKNELKLLSSEIKFLKDCMIDMVNNLTYLNKIKLYDNVINGYNVIFNELRIIKDKLFSLPDDITINYLKEKEINQISKDIIMIKTDMIRFINHISPSNIIFVMKLFLGNEWDKNFKKNDIDKIHLMSRLFNGISVWDSTYHLKPINYLPVAQTNRVVFPKEILATIIDENIKSAPIIIGDINAFPLFLKNLSDMALKDKKMLKNERKINFNHMEVLGLFNNSTDNIVFTKLHNINSLVEEKNGFNIIIRIEERIIILQGLVKDDMMELYKTNNYINGKYSLIKKYIIYDMITVPKVYRVNYLDIINVRDILISTPEEIGNIIKKRYNDYKTLRGKHLTQIINEFLISSKMRKLDILTVFLCGNEYDNKMAFLLYDILRMKDKKDIISDIYNALPLILKTKLDNIEPMINNEEEKLVKNHVGELSYERRINMLNVSSDIKDKAIEKLKSMKNNFQGDNKAQSWLDGFLKLPFGSYRDNNIMNFRKNFIEKLNSEQKLESFDMIDKYIKSNNISNDLVNEWDEYKINRSNYLKNVHKSLDDAVYGHKEAKIQLERLFAQWINGETKGAVIGLWGPPGTGKTSLAKNGLSKCLIDNDGKPRPFAFLPIGGSVNGSTLAGHNYTYDGSTWGRIADILMINNCMNPIIFIDEVDKISNTEYGKEIVSVLTHMTDATQNDHFEDKYFSGIPLDLSKALIVFSFNDITLLDPILKDRITVIETKPYTLQEKIHIINEYMLPEVLKDVGFHKDEILFGTDIIKYIVETYTNEAGVRKVKEKIVEIVRDINLQMIHDNTIKPPYTVTIKYIDELFKNKPKMRITMIHKQPEIGLVNGLYATTSGVGGLTVIQVMKFPSDKMLDLKITGQQGDVMKESVEYALRIAYNMLTDAEKEVILEDSRNKKNFGLLVHTPEAATKKDGPSAGAAMTLAIYSILSNKKVRNDIAMTGEIDLCKTVRPIGGVSAKLSGAKAAGVRLALIPSDNMDDLNILRNENISPEDDTFKVETIETFEDVIKKCIV